MNYDNIARYRYERRGRRRGGGDARDRCEKSKISALYPCTLVVYGEHTECLKTRQMTSDKTLQRGTLALHPVHMYYNISIHISYIQRRHRRKDKDESSPFCSATAAADQRQPVASSRQNDGRRNVKQKKKPRGFVTAREHVRDNIINTL